MKFCKILNKSVQITTKGTSKKENRSLINYKLTNTIR